MVVTVVLVYISEFSVVRGLLGYVTISPAEKFGSDNEDGAISGFSKLIRLLSNIE